MKTKQIIKIISKFAFLIYLQISCIYNNTKRIDNFKYNLCFKIKYFEKILILIHLWQIYFIN